MIFVGFPLTRILKLTLPKVRFAFSFHFIISPLAFIISPSFFKLILSLTMFEVTFLLTDVLSTNSFVINLVYSIKFFIILPFASHSSAQFAIVSTGYRQRRIIWADICPLNSTSRVASWSIWLSATTHAFSYATMVISQINWIWSCHW